ncbi:methyltransferase domain-containing protein [Ectothiorhodospiraceae bacterium 2226]|nr:methyltransferase domain-containing protein [Ectothiorhodospiraceae bacterium 2226]
MAFRQATRPRYCDSDHEVWEGLRAWYASPVGQHLYRCEQEVLQSVLPDLFGYHLLQLGRLGEDDLTASSRVRHRVVLEADPQARTDACAPAGVVALPHALPLAPDSVDVLVLPHSLEFSSDPHRLLREAERALVPEGHLVILGFSPWGSWAPWRLAAARSGQFPWCGRALTLARVRDWVKLLGLQIVGVQGYFFRPPLRGGRMMRMLRWMERAGQRWPALGGGFLLVARKRVVTLTPVRPRWRPRRALVPGLTQPGMRRDEGGRG